MKNQIKVVRNTKVRKKEGGVMWIKSSPSKELLYEQKYLFHCFINFFLLLVIIKSCSDRRGINDAPSEPVQRLHVSLTPESPPRDLGVPGMGGEVDIHFLVYKRGEELGRRYIPWYYDIREAPSGANHNLQPNQLRCLGGVSSPATPSPSTTALQRGASEPPDQTNLVEER